LLQYKALPQRQQRKIRLQLTSHRYSPLPFQLLSQLITLLQCARQTMSRCPSQSRRRQERRQHLEVRQHAQLVL
jgi:hypothetical protein